MRYFSVTITTEHLAKLAVLGKNIRGPGPSSFGMQQRLSEITIEVIKKFGGLRPIWGA